MKAFKKVLSLMLCVALLAALLCVAASASGTLYVKLGETFDVPFSCNCEDASNWNVYFDSNCVEALYYNPRGIGSAGAAVTCKANCAGRDTLIGNCGVCGGRTQYSIVIEEDQPVHIGLHLDESNLYLDEGDSRQINAYWAVGAQVNLTWSSSKPSVVSCFGNGGSAALQANAPGDAVITVMDNVSGESDRCYVHVNGGSKNYNISITSPYGANYRQYAAADPLYAPAVLTTPDGTRTSSGITYQWYYGTSYTNINNYISGATSPYYTPDTSTVGTLYYVCKATYAVGSVDVSAATTPVAITVLGQAYGIYLTASQSSFYAGSSVTLTARLYNANGSLVYGSYPVMWTNSNSTVGALASSTTYSSNGTASNILQTAVFSNAKKSSTITVSAFIDGVTYTDSVSVTVLPVSPTPTPTTGYSLSVAPVSTRISSGEKTNVTVKLLQNGKQVTNLAPTVTWSLKNANDKAFLNTASTIMTSGTATNTLNAAYPSGNGLSNVTVTASVTINGATYSGSTNVGVQATQAANRIVMQIDNRVITMGSNSFTNDVAPIIRNNRTYVPVAIVTQLLGGTSDWNNATRTVTLSINGKVLTMTIGQIISGFDVAPFIMNNRTYVPIAYIAQAIGSNVEWVSGTRQIVITK